MNKTPRYEYRLDKLEQKVKNLCEQLKGLKIIYSLKANRHPKIIEKLIELKVDFDVASEGELEHILNLGVSPNRISAIGPAKTEKFIDKIIKNEIAYIVIESKRELELIEKKYSFNKTKIILRINPGTVSFGERLSYKSRPSQFGIDEDMVSTFLDQMDDLNKVEGFHFHYGSQLKNEMIISSTLQHSFNFCNNLVDKYNLKLERVNIGGGFPVDYFQRNKIELNNIGNILNLNSSSGSWENSIELGRYIVAESGDYIASVVDIKKSNGKNFLILNGGFSTNALATGVGHIIKKNFLVTTSSLAETTEVYTVVGPSCYQQDILLNDIELPVLNIGDEVIFKNCGAYGQDFSPSNFLGLPKAEEIFL